MRTTCAGDVQPAAKVIEKDFTMHGDRELLISAPIANRQQLTVESSQTPDERCRSTWVRIMSTLKHKFMLLPILGYVFMHPLLFVPTIPLKATGSLCFEAAD